MSARLAAKVTGSTSGDPSVVGSAVAVALGLAVAVAVGLAVAVAVGLEVAVAVGVAVAVAVAVGLAVIPPPRCCSAKATEESSSTSTALAVNRSKTFFMKHPLYALLRCVVLLGSSPC
jgi:hypothetical protein